MDIEGKSKLSPKAQEAWDQLDKKTRREIQKDNPFKYNRNRAIRELKAKGIRTEILAELTGLNRGTIFKIVKKETLISERQKQEPDALVVWRALDQKTRETIQKDNPFRNDRDNAIRELVARGVTYSILEEITGMSDSRIREIVNRVDIFTFMTQRKLDDLKKSFEIFYEALSTILKGRVKK